MAKDSNDRANTLPLSWCGRTLAGLWNTGTGPMSLQERKKTSPARSTGFFGCSAIRQAV